MFTCCLISWKSNLNASWSLTRAARRRGEGRLLQRGFSSACLPCISRVTKEHARMLAPSFQNSTLPTTAAAKMIIAMPTLNVRWTQRRSFALPSSRCASFSLRLTSSSSSGMPLPSDGLPVPSITTTKLFRRRPWPSVAVVVILAAAKATFLQVRTTPDGNCLSHACSLGVWAAPSVCLWRAPRAAAS